MHSRLYRWILVKVTVVELREVRQLRLVQHGHASPVDVDDPVVAQLPDDAVSMYRRNAERLADLLLRQRHFERIAGRAAGDGEAPAKFDDGMGKPAGRRPLTDIDDPLAKYCGIDQSVTPEHF